MATRIHSCGGGGGKKYLFKDGKFLIQPLKNVGFNIIGKDLVGENGEYKLEFNFSTAGYQIFVELTRPVGSSVQSWAYTRIGNGVQSIFVGGNIDNRTNNHIEKVIAGVPSGNKFEIARNFNTADGYAHVVNKVIIHSIWAEKL